MDLDLVKNAVEQFKERGDSNLVFLKDDQGEVYATIFNEKQRNSDANIQTVHIPQLQSLKKIHFRKSGTSFYLFENGVLYIDREGRSGKFCSVSVTDFKVVNHNTVVIYTVDSQLISWRYNIEGVERCSWNTFNHEMSVIAEHVKDWIPILSVNLVSFIDESDYYLMELSQKVPVRLGCSILQSAEVWSGSFLLTDNGIVRVTLNKNDFNLKHFYPRIVSPDETIISICARMYNPYSGELKLFLLTDKDKLYMLSEDSSIEQIMPDKRFTALYDDHCIAIDDQGKMYFIFNKVFTPVSKDKDIVLHPLSYRRKSTKSAYH